MSNIGEAQITRLTRERLAAIKKFLPVRDSFRDNLQAQQQPKMDFSTDTQQLFAPITTATMEVGKQTQEYLKTLPKDIVEAQFTKIPNIPPPPPDTPPPPVQPELLEETIKSKLPKRNLDPKNIFKSDIIDYIKTLKTDTKIAQFAVESFSDPSRETYINKEYDIGDKKIWYKKVYLANIGKTQLPPNDSNFKQILKMIDQIENPPTPVKPFVSQRSQDDDSQSDIEKTGEGYRRNTSVSNIPCSRNILDDVSRLEVLIGGKRAGNNSPQIINEATEICQRLFQGKIIDMGLYRNLVNELIDVDYYSD